MKKIIIIVIIISCIALIGFEVKTSDLKNAFDLIVERVKDKKPEANTEEMVDYLINKAKNDSKSNDEKTLSFATDYIRDNIEKNDNNTMENLIYYGALLQYSPKNADTEKYTIIGMKTIEAVKEVYVKDNEYKSAKDSIDKTKLQIIKALISKVDIS